MTISSKQQRLADALKKNLLKRKQQKQERQADAHMASSPLKPYEPIKNQQNFYR